MQTRDSKLTSSRLSVKRSSLQKLKSQNTSINFLAQKRFSLKKELQEPISKSSFVTKEKDSNIIPKSFIEEKVSGFGKVLTGKLEKSLAYVAKANKID